MECKSSLKKDEIGSVYKKIAIFVGLWIVDCEIASQKFVIINFGLNIFGYEESLSVGFCGYFGFGVLFAS